MTSMICRRDNDRLRATSIEMMMPPQLNHRPRAHSLSRMYQGTTYRGKTGRRHSIDTSEKKEISPKECKQVQWSTFTDKKPTYVDVDSYDDLVFQIAGLQNDPTKSIAFIVADFLARAATHLGYTFDTFPIELDSSKMSPMDYRSWRRLAQYPWEVEAEFQYLHMTKKCPGNMEIALSPPSPTFIQRLFLKPKPPKRITLDSIQIIRLRCTQEAINSCLSFGQFQFELEDVARLCLGEV